MVKSIKWLIMFTVLTFDNTFVELAFHYLNFIMFSDAVSGEPLIDMSIKVIVWS